MAPSEVGTGGRHVIKSIFLQVGKLRQSPLWPGRLLYPHDSAFKSVSAFFPQDAGGLSPNPLCLRAELQAREWAGPGHPSFLPWNLRSAGAWAWDQIERAGIWLCCVATALLWASVSTLVKWGDHLYLVICPKQTSQSLPLLHLAPSFHCSHQGGDFSFIHMCTQSSTLCQAQVGA